MKREHSEQAQLPSGYTELEYLESTGTQYIDTRVGNLNMVGIKTEVAYTDITIQSSMGWGASRFKEVFRFECYPNGFLYYFGDDTYTFITIKTTPDTNWHTWDLQPGSQKFDGEEYSQRTITRTGNTLYLFALHAGWTSSLTAPCYCKMKYCNIVSNGSLVRKFVPALRISDNKPGLYDICGSICPLTGTPFYVNAGTGEFLYE